MELLTRKQEIPAMFSSLSKAGESLVSYWHLASYSASDVWDPMNEKLPAVPEAATWQEKSMSILARWTSAYDAYLNVQSENMTDIKRKGTAVLCILKELGSAAAVFTRTTLNDQTNWDAFYPMFQKIVSLAEEIIELDLKSTVVRPKFCMDMAIIGPLFEVSSRSNKLLPCYKISQVV
jgi:hypothetical protein